MIHESLFFVNVIFNKITKQNVEKSHRDHWRLCRLIANDQMNVTIIKFILSFIIEENRQRRQAFRYFLLNLQKRLVF